LGSIITTQKNHHQIPTSAVPVCHRRFGVVSARGWVFGGNVARRGGALAWKLDFRFYREFVRILRLITCRGDYTGCVKTSYLLSSDVVPCGRYRFDLSRTFKALDIFVVSG